MPITLTLSDEQALQIMAQVGQLLKPRDGNGSPFAERSSVEQAATVIRKFVNDLPVDTVFRHSELLYKLEKYNVTAHSISYTLSTLKEDGIVTMLRRGTWQKIKKGVAA